MAAIPLNSFKTIRADVTTGITTMYTAPTGVASVVILAQITNVSSGIVTVTSYHGRDGTSVEIVKDFEIPENDVLNLLDGRLALETGDTVEVQGSSNSTMKAILSILETAK